MYRKRRTLAEKKGPRDSGGNCPSEQWLRVQLLLLSVGRIRQCVTSFESHRRDTDRSLKVSISSYRHRSVQLCIIICVAKYVKKMTVEGFYARTR